MRNDAIAIRVVQAYAVIIHALRCIMPCRVFVEGCGLYAVYKDSINIWDSLK